MCAIKELGAYGGNHLGSIGLLGQLRLHLACVKLLADQRERLKDVVLLFVDEVLLSVTDLHLSTERVKLVLPLAFPPRVRLETQMPFGACVPLGVGELSGL